MVFQPRPKQGCDLPPILQGSGESWVAPDCPFLSRVLFHWGTLAFRLLTPVSQTASLHPISFWKTSPCSLLLQEGRFNMHLGSDGKGHRSARTKPPTPPRENSRLGSSEKPPLMSALSLGKKKESCNCSLVLHVIVNRIVVSFFLL